MTGKDSDFDRCNIYDSDLIAHRAHGGEGLIRFRRIATSEQVSGPCNFLDFARVPPGTTIGEHTHAENEEEFYLILHGRGLMRCNQDEFEVRAGDLIRNPPGGTHSLVNTSDEDLQMFVFELRV